ncbi:MAG: hypothetical protein LBB81_04165 [Treponema sp.]|jgi:hypothetical protein|nr:hypothetical protein [Treponema sp.]
MKNVIFILIMLFLTAGFLTAQTAAELETILKTTAVSCAQAVKFVAASVNSADSAGTVTEKDAFNTAVNEGWLSKKAEAEKPITLAELSFLIMKAFDLKGGMMYAILPGPRYAYRSMISRSFIRGDADPAMTVSGDRFLLILGNVLNAEGSVQGGGQ